MIAYIEMIGGASGNMLLGAFVDAGLDLDALLAQLRTIPVSGWTIERDRVVKRGIAATYVDFVIPGEDPSEFADDAAHHAATHEHPHDHDHDHARDHHHEGKPSRRLADVLAILERSALSPRAKAIARDAYERLARAEATTHGQSIETVLFHEVGEIDAILDIAAFAVALDLLEIDEVYCSPFPVGHGAIRIAHGSYPNPPPATAELLRDAPTFDGGVRGEMVTPTGAAILRAVVREPGRRPGFVARRIGYGAGRSNFTIPNVVRLSLGDRVEKDSIALECDEIAILEANIDDMSPQHFEVAIERMLAAGAFDVWLAPVTMKKLRPAIIVGAIAPLEREAAVAYVLLRETTTLGVRVRRERRYTLPRRIDALETKWGTIRVKVATVDGAERRTFEYDDLARIARETGEPLARIVATLQGTIEV